MAMVEGVKDRGVDSGEPDVRIVAVEVPALGVSGEQSYLTFRVADVEPGVEYLYRACAGVVTGETNLSNNCDWDSFTTRILLDDLNVSVPEDRRTCVFI